MRDARNHFYRYSVFYRALSLPKLDPGMALSNQAELADVLPVGRSFISMVKGYADSKVSRMARLKRAKRADWWRRRESNPIGFGMVL